MEHQGQYSYDYPRASVTTDCVIFGYNGQNLKVLLIKRGEEPFKDKWAFPGGFLKMNETLEECARRELMEETSFCPDVLEQFHAFSSINRDPRERVITVAFFALVKPGEVKGGDDAAEAQWFNTHEMPPLAFDHNEIFKEALKHLRERIHFEPIGFNLLGDKFTLPQLQRIYETILDTTFDRRNFQRKMMMNDLLIPVEEPTEHIESSRVCCDAIPKPEPSFEKEKNMEMRPISELFEIAKNLSGDCSKAKSKPGKYEVGRKPKWFRFNLVKYLQLKKEIDSKLDF